MAIGKKKGPVRALEITGPGQGCEPAYRVGSGVLAGFLKLYASFRNLNYILQG
jgi:hypothetical protein